MLVERVGEVTLGAGAPHAVPSPWASLRSEGEWGLLTLYSKCFEVVFPGREDQPPGLPQGPCSFFFFFFSGYATWLVRS